MSSKFTCLVIQVTLTGGKRSMRSRDNGVTVSMVSLTLTLMVHQLISGLFVSKSHHVRRRHDFHSRVFIWLIGQDASC